MVSIVLRAWNIKMSKTVPVLKELKTSWNNEQLMCKYSTYDIYICLQDYRESMWGVWERGFLGGPSGKEPICQCRRHKRNGLAPWIRKIPWRRAWQPTPVYFPGESHGQRSLEGHGPESQTVRQDWSDLAGRNTWEARRPGKGRCRRRWLSGVGWVGSNQEEGTE